MPDTKSSILDAAETAFAEKGVHGISLRAILAGSGINTALAHYHFGSKANLLREVLLRRFTPLTEERMRRLDELESRPGDPGYTLREVLRAFLAPALRLLEQAPQFARFLGQVGAVPDETLEAFYAEHFTPSLRRFSAAMKRVLPRGMTESQRIARGFFLLGLIGWTLTNSDRMEVMSAGRFPVLRGEEFIEELVAFTEAGFLAGFPTEKGDDRG